MAQQLLGASSFGVFRFTPSPIRQRLSERLISEGYKKQLNKVFLIGQGQALTNIEDIIDFCIKRDFPRLTVKEVMTLKTQFIPKGHLPDNPRVVDFKRRDFAQGLVQKDDKKMTSALRGSIGEEPEAILYKALREYFEAKNEVCFVIKNVDMWQLDPEKRKDKLKREFDFVLINLTNHYVMDLEVKRTLGTRKMGKHKKSALDSAREQVQACKSFFEDWFSAEVSQDWRFIGAAFTLQVGEEVEKNDFIIEGPQELPDKMDKIMKELQNQRPKVEKSKTEEFIKMVKYTIYCACATELPINGNYKKMVKRAMKDSGSIENIQLWCWATPQQKSFMDIPWIVFLAPWGCGKTLFMSAKAIELAKKGEKVLFLIFQADYESKEKSLLAQEVEDRFKDFPNIKVQIVMFKDGVSNNFQKVDAGFQHIFFDEFFADLEMFQEATKREIFRFQENGKFSTFWLAISNFYHHQKLPNNINLEKEVTRQFPRFQVVSMKKPLRYSKNIADELKRDYLESIKSTDLAINQRLFAESSLPPNLAEGFEIKVLGLGKIKLLPELMIETFNTFPEEQKTLIVIDDNPTRPENQMIQEMITCRSCKTVIWPILMKIAFYLCGREEPLFHLLHHSSGEEHIKKWINGEENIKDLIVSSRLLNGFEADFVIDTTYTNVVASRATTQLVRLIHNPFLSLLMAKEILLFKDHVCEDVMKNMAKLPMFTLDNFLDDKLNSKGFVTSTTSPFPIDYKVDGRNPIFEALADQMKNNEQETTGSELARKVIHGLRIGAIKWPKEIADSLILEEDWLRKMESSRHPFHYSHSKNSEEMKGYEEILLELSAQYLRRQIIVIPFLEGEKVLHFPQQSPSLHIKMDSFYLCAAMNLYNQNFFLSIFPTTRNMKRTRCNLQ